MPSEAHVGGAAPRPADTFSAALFADLYEFTMAAAYVRNGMLRPATFSLFFRKLPAERGYLVCAGLEDVLAFLEAFRFATTDLNYLRSLGLFGDEFLAYMDGLRFTGTVRAMAEGTPFFPNEPVVEVTAPLPEAQLVETFIVNQIHLQTMLATKAARVVDAARGRRVIDFSARRAHGIDAADKLARVSYLAGFDGTSNVQAGALYGVPVFGTMAHSFVTACASEADAFRNFAAAFPQGTTLLVDTFDTLAGTANAIRVGREMRAAGHTLRAIRLDSGDLVDLSRQARAMLDAAGLLEVQILASGGLDEFEVERLLAAGAPIDAFAVGTKVGVSADAPYADCAYKMVAYDGRPVLKLSAGKQTLPGPKQVFRRRGPDGMLAGDLITCEDEPPSAGAERLLEGVMNGGKRTPAGIAPPLAALRERFATERSRIPVPLRRLRSPAPYEVTVSPKLRNLERRVIAEVRAREGLPVGGAIR